MQKRYRTDENFREKVKKQANQWYKDNRDQIIITWREHYANRTPEQIQARKNYLKKLRSRYRSKDCTYGKIPKRGYDLDD